MATKAKYTRVQGKQETTEKKADTDIIMRRSPTYGRQCVTQASTSDGP